MYRAVITLIAGAIIGAASAYVIVDRTTKFAPAQQQGAGRGIPEVPKMSEATAALHRTDRYEHLNSVKDIMALPSEFAQSEAFYVLAGRSDSSGVQRLLSEANGMVAASDRERALSILFARLTELDPASALAMARSTTFSETNNVESGVWQSWARYDLESALFAAKEQSTPGRRNLAAQALFTAYGYLGNETTDRIEHELGIRPDRTLRGKYLYKLADRSPAAAIQYISNIQSSREQSETVYWLAAHLVRTEPEGAQGYADLITDPVMREQYENTVSSSMAAVDPESLLDRLVSGSGTKPGDMEIYGAMRELVSRDIDRALFYFDQISSQDQRRRLGHMIVQELARKDPTRAISWARDNEDSYQMMTMRALSQIAMSDPQMAMAEANKIAHASKRVNTISNIVSSVARNDPVQAAYLIDRIENDRERANAAEHLVSTWADQDPDAAINWVLESDNIDKTSALNQIGYLLARQDIDAAIRLLPRLDEKSAPGWKRQIALNLATQRSLVDAQNFINQFEGSQDFNQLQAAVASGISESDNVAARQFVEQMPSGADKEAAYAQLVRRHAQTSPSEAARWLASITDAQQRSFATGQVANAWHSQDPVAAQQWADNLPRGSTRDDAIVGLASSWDELTPSRRLMIESIGSAEKQTQATIARIHIIARTDWRKAQSALNSLSIPSTERHRIQKIIDHYRNRQ